MAINYTKIGWDTSKYVNPTNMNQMDDGIKAACDAIDSEVVKLSSAGAQTIVNTSTGQRTALVIKSGMSNQGWLGIRDGDNNVQGSFGAKTDVPYFMTANGTDKEIALVNTITKINPYADSVLTITAAPSDVMPGVYCGYAGPGTSGFPNYGMATVIRATQGGSALELFTPYDPNYGGEHIKARIGRGISDTWSDWKELAYLDEVATRTIITVNAGESVTVTNLPRAYSISCNNAGMGAMVAVYIGSGYGGGTARHKIAAIVETTYFTFTPDNTVYGLVIQNNSDRTAMFAITAIG